MKRFSLASVMVMVAFIALTAYFAREGIDLHRRGFTPGEIATVIGVPVGVGAVACWAGGLPHSWKRASGDTQLTSLNAPTCPAKRVDKIISERRQTCDDWFPRSFKGMVIPEAPPHIVS
jgi:hypothetical protein